VKIFYNPPTLTLTKSKNMGKLVFAKQADKKSKKSFNDLWKHDIPITATTSSSYDGIKIDRITYDEFTHWDTGRQIKKPGKK
jgi:hypothetical protein